MTVHSFTMCGVDLGVECETPTQDARVTHLLVRLFAVHPQYPHRDQAAIVIRFRPGLRRSDSAGRIAERNVFQSEFLNVLATDGGYSVRCGSSFLELDLANSLAEGCLNDDFWNVPLQAQRAFFFLPLLFLLPQHGLYGLHANGLVKDGVGFLVAGGSGRGKTTLTLALLRQGWGYVSDDTVMLHASGEGIEALNFRRGFACTRETLARFPEFSELDAPVAWKADKTLVNVDRLYPNRQVARCAPGVILLPEVARTECSSIVPLSSSAALSMLIRQSPGVLTQRASVEDQMEVLRRLVTGTRHWRVLLGMDVYRDAATVSRLLWDARNPHDGQDCC